MRDAQMLPLQEHYRGHLLLLRCLRSDASLCLIRRIRNERSGQDFAEASDHRRYVQSLPGKFEYLENERAVPKGPAKAMELLAGHWGLGLYLDLE